MKKILFICGSPRKDESSSLWLARYLSIFLEYDHEFVDINELKLKGTVLEEDENFQKVLNKINDAHCILWVFGVYAMCVPMKLFCFLEKLRSYQYPLNNKIAGSVMTSMHIMDDRTSRWMKNYCEDSGMIYSGDVSAGVDRLCGYKEARKAESACRHLARRVNCDMKSERTLDCLKQGPVRFFDPGQWTMDLPRAGKNKRSTGIKKIVVLAEDRERSYSYTGAILKAMEMFSENNIQVIFLNEKRIEPCRGCYVCNVGGEGKCIRRDDYDFIDRKINDADGIIYLCHGSLGSFGGKMKLFVERDWIMRPKDSFKGKWGFSICVGEGRSGYLSSVFLRDIMVSQGVGHLENLYLCGETKNFFIKQLKWAVEKLDHVFCKDLLLFNKYTFDSSREIFIRAAQDEKCGALSSFPKKLSKKVFLTFLSRGVLREYFARKKMKENIYSKKNIFEEVLQNYKRNKGKKGHETEKYEGVAV